MGLLDIFGSSKQPARKMSIEQSIALAEEAVHAAVPPTPAAYYGSGYTSVQTYAISYDGEKNLGEMGPAKLYGLDYATLRIRSWQLYLDSEVIQTVYKKFLLWVIGSGLKLQAEPQKDVLKAEKMIAEDDLGETFSKTTESRFKVYTRSKQASYSGDKNLHQLAGEAFNNSRIGGDVLVVLRYVDGFIKVQLIDGCHVGNPANLRADVAGKGYIWTNGNTIRHGIELNERGGHVAYHVRTANFKWERIEAYSSKTGMRMAYMVYGLKYRLDDVRAMPLIAAVMETAKKLERYKEATIGSAEERQKIPYFIKHGINSTGENPLQKGIAKIVAGNKPGDKPVDVNGQVLADNIAASTNKQVFNMPQDSELVSLDSKNELYFKDFFSVNIDLICATVGIPPEVAMDKYDSNFSSARAAIKSWEHNLNVTREDFAAQFYQPIYDLWQYVEVLNNKIEAPGYLKAVLEDNKLALEAYRYARFVGANVPHIDPEKEVRAERLKLGDAAGMLPLTTLERATEVLNGGDSTANVAQFAREWEDFKKYQIEQAPQPNPNNNPPPEEPGKK